MTDLFNEVDEQLRSDRFQAVAARLAPWLMGAAILLIVASFGIWGWNRHQSQLTARASETYARALDAAAKGETDVAYRLFGQVAKTGPRSYKSLALMQQGAERMTQKKPAEAAALFDQAAEAAPDPLIGDAARLKAAFALMDAAPYKDIEARLTPLLKQDRPYRVEAREALAFAKLTSGDLAGARGDFVVISNLLDASESAQRRATAAIGLIDSGSAKALPAAMKAAAAAPPMVMPALPPGVNAAPQPQASGSQ